MKQENESIGFLVVNVKTANGALPVENANVTIYGSGKLDENGTPALLDSDIIFNLTTDRNGKTPKVSLHTKDRNLSLSPENTIPYDTYNIFVSADGYYDNSYLNVPIFQGITSLQGVNLIPLSEFSAPNDYIPNSQRSYNEQRR
ncbi:MAG: hypothetical protein J6A96_01275 [Clostridia bacterium]|nr:hypothetical protein [Clostridia bacterium]